MADPNVLEQMRVEWNARAQEDANYYVAFGRRQQDDDEFFASGADVVRALESELKRLPPRQEGWTALEIGCGPGRLIRPMSRHFREIHGVDVADRMIQLAAARLTGIPNAHVHVTPDSSLSLFRDESFDFAYSYAVFQHIPSRDVVLHYLTEVGRILRPGGILRCQINGLPEQAARYTTWAGVRISADEVAAFARRHDFQLLALEGISTQYMWTTWRKQSAGWRASLRPPVERAVSQIRSISNTHSGEPLTPQSGSLAAASLWVRGLPPDADLLDLAVLIDGVPGRLTYLGHPAWDGVQQLNVAVPSGSRTGLVPVELRWMGQLIAPLAWLRIIPSGPTVPRVCSVTDGVDLLSGPRILSGSVKVTLEEVASADLFAASIGGLPVRDIDAFCTDPLTQRFEVNFSLPESLAPGSHLLRLSLGKRAFPPVPIQIA